MEYCPCRSTPTGTRGQGRMGGGSLDGNGVHFRIREGYSKYEGCGLGLEQCKGAVTTNEVDTCDMGVGV
eukprot:618132-Hanusia_phi.AAC.1